MTNGNDTVHPRMSGNKMGQVESVVNFGGLSKRELFAAMAMQGMLANSDGIKRLYRDAGSRLNTGRHDLLAKDCIEQLAMTAVLQTDELIKQLNEGANDEEKEKNIQTDKS